MEIKIQLSEGKGGKRSTASSVSLGSDLSIYKTIKPKIFSTKNRKPKKEN